MAMDESYEHCPSCREANFDPLNAEEAECRDCGCVWNTKTGAIVREPPDDWNEEE